MFCNILPIFLPPETCVNQIILHYLWEKFILYIMKLFELNQYIYKLSFIFISLFVIILWGTRWLNGSAASVEQIKKSLGFGSEKGASTRVFSTITIYDEVKRIECLPEVGIVASLISVHNKGHPAEGKGLLYLSG